MRVMHVITGLRTGGAENQLLLLTRHTSTEPVVVALTNADEIAEALQADGVTVHDVGMRSNKDLAAIGRLARLMRSHRPDVVHLHLYRATLYGRVAARLARVPVVVTTEHSLLDGVLEGRRTSAWVRRLYVATERLNAVTIAVSEAVADRLRRWGVAPAKLRVVPNGVDLEALQVDAERGRALRRELGVGDARLVAGIGRLHHTKRWDHLLRALADDLDEDLQVVLFGGGEEEAALRDLATSLGISDRVHLPGPRADLAAVLSAVDVVVSPSPQETFGLSLVEAVAAGRPVVYVSSPGLEALGPLPGAVQVPEDPTTLRDAVLAALRGPAPLPPPEALRRYDVRTVAQQVDDVYRECWEAVRGVDRRFRPARDR